MHSTSSTTLHQEVINLLHILLTFSRDQLSSLLWKCLHFKDTEETRWDPAQLIYLVQSMTPHQLQQLRTLTNEHKEASIKQEEVPVPVHFFSYFASLFQLFNFQHLLCIFSSSQLTKLFEVMKSLDTQYHQLQLIQQLQQIFTQTSPKILDKLYEEAKTTRGSFFSAHLLHKVVESELLSSYLPIKTLCQLEKSEWLSLPYKFSSLTTVQMLQLLRLLQLPSTTVIELKQLFPTTIVPALEVPVQLGLQMFEAPPTKAVAQRNVKPHPSVQLVGAGEEDTDLFVVPILIRCDTKEEVPELLQGGHPSPITSSGYVTFRKLKIMKTSEEESDTLFALRFELRRSIGVDDFEVMSNITSEPILVVQGSNSSCLCKRKSPPPTLIETIPAQGSASGGKRIAILGANFEDRPALRVRFGDSLEVVPEFVGPGTLVCTVPPHAPGEVLVRVANAHDTWSAEACAFTYVAESISASS